VKKNLKPCVYKLWKHVKVRPRTFCRTVRRVAAAGKVKWESHGAEARASLNRANESAEADPKPGDLSMSRLKRK
jgi:hypothetical protein